MAKLGKSQREKDIKRVASVAPFRGGLLLFGRRADNGKWTLPGGHLEPGEDPEQGARRELMEEAGYGDLRGDFKFIGAGEIPERNLIVYCFLAEVPDQQPTAANDPDAEMETWRWVDPENIPDEIAGNLHNPENVTLQLLGLQDGRFAEDLGKMSLPPEFSDHAMMAARHALNLYGPRVAMAAQRIAPKAVEAVKQVAPKIKQAVGAVKGFLGKSDEDLEKMAQIDQTQNPDFQKWFTGSKVTHPETGKPLTVYHGTTHNFDSFSHKNGNSENYYGRAHYFTSNPDDVSHNYAGIGPDLKNRIEHETERHPDYYENPAAAEEAARSRLVGPSPRVIPAHLKMKNPVEVFGRGGTRFSIEHEYDEAGEPVKETGNGVKLVNAIREVAPRYNVDPDDLLAHVTEGANLYDGATAGEIEDALRSHPGVMEATDEDGNYVGNELVRDVWQQAGHDGIILDAHAAFGPKKDLIHGGTYGGMQGVTPGTKHYIVFNPRQIKGAFNQTFNSRSPNFGKDEMPMEKVQRWAYHGTSKKQAQKIMRQGLIPQHDDVAEEAGADVGPFTYYTADPEHARQFGGDDAVVLRFPWPTDHEENPFAPAIGPEEGRTRTPVHPRHIQLVKNEPMEKGGAMSRLAPFNPAKPQDRLEPYAESDLAAWQSHDAEERPDPGMVRGARIRALHKLSAATKVRTNPQTGDREFLLHRGMSPEERKATHKVPGFVNHEEGQSSWTPRLSTARSFARDYAGGDEENGFEPYVASAWIPESAISLVPKQYGALDNRAVEHEDDEEYKPPVGENRFADEHEVIVDAGHNSALAKPHEVEEIAKPLASLHGRINRAGRDERTLVLSPDARPVMARDRLQHRKDKRPGQQLSLPLPRPSRLPPFRRSETEKLIIENWVSSLKKDEPLNLLDVAHDDGELDQATGVAEDMLGFYPQVRPEFEAAQFLASAKKPAPLTLIRQALYHFENDFEGAALAAYGLPVDESSRKALRAVIDLKKPALQKSEGAEEVPEAREVVAAMPEAEQAAIEVKRALLTKRAKPIHLNGKHSSGTIVAKDPESSTVYLLKPGSGGQSPAAGADQDPSSQSRREAAFWYIADAWGLGSYIPRADLLLVDGQEWAALRMLPFSWQNLDKRRAQDPSLPQRVLARYRDDGVLHKWAVLDYILGNPDRHGQNLMVDADGKQLALIDHGSAFAGDEFDPANDKNSFVPYYLRAWSSKRFNSLPVDQKLQVMPRVSKPTQQVLRAWFDGIHADRLEAMLHRFGIDPRPALERLARLKVIATNTPVDQAINRLWVTT